MKPKIRKLVPAGSTRCVQATFRMVVEAYTGTDPGLERTDEITGYVEGRGTWQFRMLLGLASFGLCSNDHENFSVSEFVNDPELAIRKQFVHEAAVEGILAESDLQTERLALAECVKSPLVHFTESVPKFEDIEEEIGQGRLVMANVNLRVLQGKEGREGHVIIVDEIREDELIVHDPGVGGGLYRSIARSLFEAAWFSPSVDAASYISVWDCRDHQQ